MVPEPVPDGIAPIVAVVPKQIEVSGPAFALHGCAHAPIELRKTIINNPKWRKKQCFMS